MRCRRRSRSIKLEHVTGRNADFQIVQQIAKPSGAGFAERLDREPATFRMQSPGEIPVTGGFLAVSGLRSVAAHGQAPRHAGDDNHLRRAVIAYGGIARMHAREGSGRAAVKRKLPRAARGRRCLLAVIEPSDGGEPRQSEQGGGAFPPPAGRRPGGLRSRL